MNAIPTKILCEIAAHEGVVLQTYLDSVGVETWGVGITAASGHGVKRYIDNPQTIEHVFAIFEWSVRTRYLPDVLDAFKGHTLLEHELAGALSFHYNTGGIHAATWVDTFLDGDRDEAKVQFMWWTKNKELIGRREAERDLFFDAEWKGTTTIQQYDVNDALKPVNPKPVDISALIGEIAENPWPVTVNDRAELADLVRRELS